MSRIAPRVLAEYLLGGRLPVPGCLRTLQLPPRPLRRLPRRFAQSSSRSLHDQIHGGVSSDIGGPSEAAEDTSVAYRKQLKEDAKKRKATKGRDAAENARLSAEVIEGWELTVGIEIHAQLNTAKKLFSTAVSTINDEPNTHVALFDVAVPGSQPAFQKETLIPALRAALALNCDIQPISRFDRKHYFHWDQPAGYQITQYYQPFAKDGYITLYAHDGIAKEDGEMVRVGIKQVQMEQDTAKTTAQPGDIHLIDFNRAGLPLIEIITLPQIHHPSTAAALVRKIQILLNSVDACVLGMESGGLRADVNVSVRRSNSTAEEGGHQYAGVTGLGQRTEIKNLSSFKAVRDAIVAERNRQVEVLEAGGNIVGETRGWTLGSSETKRLRGKEGEVDYRYMPDPDLAPVVIGENLLYHLWENMGIIPDQELELLAKDYGLTMKDALSLVALDNGGRVGYFYNVVDEVTKLNPGAEGPKSFGRVCGNWVLHELGGLFEESSAQSEGLQIDLEGNCIIPADQLARIIHYLEKKRITGKTAKGLLFSLFDNGKRGSITTVDDMIDEGGLWYNPMSAEEYEELAKSVMDPRIVQQILKGQEGKIMYLVGQMMRKGEKGRVDAQEAEKVIRKAIEEHGQ